MHRTKMRNLIVWATSLHAASCALSIITYKGDDFRGNDFLWKLQNPKMIHRLRGGSQQPAALPAYIGVTDVTTKSHEHMRVEAFADGQASILADEPTGFNIGENAELKGQSRGWSPVHYQLAGLATCTSITITVVARDQGFKYKGLRTGIRSLIDIRGFFFDLHLQPKFEQINFDLWLDTDESVDRIKALADETDRRCPQLGIYRLAKVPLRIRYYREGAAAPVHEARYAIADAEDEPERRLLREAAATAAVTTSR